MILAGILLPLVAGLLVLGLRSVRAVGILLVAAAAGHAALVVRCWLHEPAPVLGGWLAADGPGLLVVSVASFLTLMVAVYSCSYLRDHEDIARPLGAGLLVFLASMTLVGWSRHMGLLWVAVEATTLASAPLICLHRDARSLEAMWKYLILCSVGIAVALLGTFFLAAAAGPGASLVVDDLVRSGATLHGTWLRVAFLCLLVGYGTKMGLAPLHNWLPDAHSEAPAPVSALLSGALLNCAFLALLQATRICDAAGLGGFARGHLLLFGFLSMATGAVFLLRQADYKRLLAYSSVEHMGVVAVGVGLGGAGLLASLIHVLAHSLTKAALFLTAGNVLTAYGTKSTGHVRGLLRTLPRTGALWVAGFLAIAGTPPFGPFLGEFLMVRTAFETGRPFLAALFLGLLAIAFVGLVGSFMRMAQGAADETVSWREPSWRLLPPAALLVGSLVVGLWLPESVLAGLQHAASCLRGAP